MSQRSKSVGSLVFSVTLSLGLVAVCPLLGQTATVEGLLDRARAAQSAGKYADAASDYARATALSPATPELWSNRGVMEYLAGKPEASIASLQHALRLNPKLYIPMLFLGKDYVQTGKPSLALPCLASAHRLKPDDPEVLITLGKAYADSAKPRQAGSAYADAARLMPESAAAWLGLGTASLAVISADGQELAASQAKSVWARALFADELLAQGRPLEAIDTYHAALASATPAEKATVARTVSWSESHPDLFPLPAKSQEALQNLDAELAADSTKALLPSCDTAEALAAAACAFWSGDYEHSSAQANGTLRKDPQNAEALYWSIKANERMSVAALARFEELAPDSAASFVMVGDLFREQRQMDNALGEYKKALAADPHNPGALLGSVVAEFANSRLDEAAATDAAALADRPNDPQLNLLMAEVLAARDQYAQARPYLERCLRAPVELQPRVHLLLAQADSRDGKTEEAIREYRIALPGDRDGSIHFQLSRLYRKTGNDAEAKKAEEQAKALIAQRRANAAVEVREMTGANP